MLVPSDTVGDEVLVHSQCHLVGGPGARLQTHTDTWIEAGICYTRARGHGREARGYMNHRRVKQDDIASRAL